jgi:hypothetical protein
MEQNEVIYSLIEKYFYLTDQSKKDFKWFLEHQEHAEEFKTIAEQPDKRLFINYPVEANENYDSSWHNFKSNFRYFVAAEGLEYKNYLENKTNKNIKIAKAIFEHYSQKNQDLFSGLQANFIENNGLFKNHMLRTIFTDKNPDKYIVNKMYFNEEGKFVLYCTNRENNKKVYLRKVIHKKTYKSALKEFGLQTMITNCLNKNYLGNRLKTTELKVCFSLNYADWLLCSTKNSWTSCLGLDNTLGYWAGLASLICDKNRIMIFITDGKEKEFMGVKSYNMIRRCWAFVLQDNAKDTYLLCNKVYPNKEICFKLDCFNVFPKDIKYIYDKNANSKTLHSKYYLPIIWHKGRRTDFTSGVYEDSLEKTFTNNMEYMYYVTNGEYGLNPYKLNCEKDFYGFEIKEAEEVRFDDNAYTCSMRNVSIVRAS